MRSLLWPSIPMSSQHSSGLARRWDMLAFRHGEIIPPNRLKYMQIRSLRFLSMVTTSSEQCLHSNLFSTVGSATSPSMPAHTHQGILDGDIST